MLLHTLNVIVLKFNLVVVGTLFLFVMNVLQLYDIEVIKLIMFSLHNQDKPSNIRRHELSLKIQQLQKVSP